ncbi:hypothetical protein OSB04_un000472 [Centaurea solstitialis]|uniref:Gag-Pol polyprotein n=1 Tax=Centaurea solstitialis TaxID=347529 RepID=A0AA38S460_9ASTR|nr:hypothetical protein OSB04_un000472 [Centaurea solstitialis]
MSKEFIGIGSESRPPVLVMGEYQQWKRRMIHFLDLLDENPMKSVREGPVKPTITIAEVPRTDTYPCLPAYTVEKPYDMYSLEQRERHVIDKRALTLLIMPFQMTCMPGDNSKIIHVLVLEAIERKSTKSCEKVGKSAKSETQVLRVREVLSVPSGKNDTRTFLDYIAIDQIQGGDSAVESQKENALNAYEGFRARENESLTESYHRLNTLVNDLRRLNVEKGRYEVNVKFLKNLTQEW